MRREHYVKDYLLTMREGRQANFTVPPGPYVTAHTGPVRFKRSVPSTGMRTQPEKNTFARRGRAVHLSANQEMGFQGGIEMNALLIFQVIFDVAEFREEYPQIEYNGNDGNRRTHTFDHWLRLKCGRRLVSSAKPVLLIETSGLEATLASIKPFVCPAFADEIHLLTEYQATDAAADIATRILKARRLATEDYVEGVRKIAGNVHGSFFLGDLAATGPVEAEYREAIWALIDEGFLRPDCVMDAPLSREWIVKAGWVDDHTLLRVVR